MRLASVASTWTLSQRTLSISSSLRAPSSHQATCQLGRTPRPKTQEIQVPSIDHCRQQEVMMARRFPNSLAILIDFPNSNSSFGRNKSTRKHVLASARAAMKGSSRSGYLPRTTWQDWQRVPRPPAGNSYISALSKLIIIITMLGEPQTRVPTLCKRVLMTSSGTRLSTDRRVEASSSLPKLLISSSNCSNNSRWGTLLLVSNHFFGLLQKTLSRALLTLLYFF